MTRDGNRKDGLGHAPRDRPPFPLSILICLTLAPIAAVASDSAGSAAGEACTSDNTLRWRGGTIRLENDLFAGTDRNYTNGIAISAVSHDIDAPLRPSYLPGPLGLYASAIRWLDPGFARGADAASATQNVVMRVGQAMYTPEDELRTDLILDDRPYAGLLYMGVAWNLRTPTPNLRRELLDSRELTLGVIGPLSLADESQNLVHKILGVARFRGWANQLHNEPAIQLALERKYRPHVDGAVQSGWGRDVIASYALRAGNIETAATAGIELRAGWNIPNDFGSYPIRPGGENRPPSAVAKLRTTHPLSAGAPRPGVHAFLNLEAKAVAWDFALDGNLYRTSHHVDRRPWVAQAAFGISSQWLVAGRGVRLALMRVWRTREYDEQVGTHAFGSVAFSVEL